MIIVDFTSPTKGRMTIKEVVQDVVAFMEEESSASYKLIVRLISQDKFLFCNCCPSCWKGSTYYYQEIYIYVKNLRHKIFTEASMSLDAVTMLKEN